MLERCEPELENSQPFPSSDREPAILEGADKLGQVLDVVSREGQHQSEIVAGVRLQAGDAAGDSELVAEFAGDVLDSHEVLACQLEVALSLALRAHEEPRDDALVVRQPVDDDIASLLYEQLRVVSLLNVCLGWMRMGISGGNVDAGRRAKRWDGVLGRKEVLVAEDLALSAVDLLLVHILLIN